MAAMLLPARLMFGGGGADREEVVNRPTNVPEPRALRAQRGMFLIRSLLDPQLLSLLFPPPCLSILPHPPTRSLSPFHALIVPSPTISLSLLSFYIGVIITLN